jgi:hypothetical protein
VKIAPPTCTNLSTVGIDTDAATVMAVTPSQGRAMPIDRPTIVVIWGDDIGITELSCCSDGLMGYRTPNIDRLAEEGMRFTDAYGEQSCTAGRAERR